MSERFCPQCNTQVEDRGGFCALGHDLRGAAPVASLKELRAEVDRAFEEARVRVAHAGDSVPPPPPGPNQTLRLEVGEDLVQGADPLVDFAPAPRMDWGPERQGLRKRLG